MMGTLHLYARKLGALAVLAALLSLAGFGVIWPAFHHLRELDERIGEARSLLNRLEASSVLDAQLSNKTQDLQSHYLPGESDAVRLAGLQSLVGDAAKAQNIQLASISTSEAEQRNGIRMLAVRAQLTSDLPRLQKLFYDLELQHRNLLIDQLNISRAPSGGANPAPVLDVNFTVLGAVPAKQQQF